MAADSPAAKEHPLEVSTIRSLTLSGNKSAEISTDGSGHSDAIDRHWGISGPRSESQKTLLAKRAGKNSTKGHPRPAAFDARGG